MTTMNPRQWFQARLRWAVLEEGYGLTHWRESEHIFLSENRDAAFQEALRLGYAEEHSLIPNEDDDRNPVIDCRFAEVVYLEERGMGRTAFEVYLGERPRQATERIDFDHVFDPEGRVPQPIF
jgi:hypothetical protein